MRNAKMRNVERTVNWYFLFTFGIPEVSSQFWKMLSAVNPDLKRKKKNKLKTYTKISFFLYES